MNPEELREKIAEFQRQIDLLDDRMESAKETKSQLQNERFELKEQRRYFRGQLREATAAGNDARVDEIDRRLMELEDRLSELDDKIETMNDTMENISDQIEHLEDTIDDLQEVLEERSERDEDEGCSWEFRVDQTVEQINDVLRKAFKKAGDALEKIDFEQVGEKAQVVAGKAAKAAADAAKSVETAWNDAKENRQQPLGVGDCRVSGSGNIDGGCYNRILVSGSCKVGGELVCRELRVSGNFRSAGKVDCSGEVRASGSMLCGGDMKAGDVNVSGSLKTEGDFAGENVSVSGGLRVGGAMKAAEVRSSGGLHVERDLEAERLESYGNLNVGGMVNAETVEIRLSLSESKVGTIGGSTVRVQRPAATGFLSGILKPGCGLLTCESVEGDLVELSAVKAQVVRGDQVVIGEGCDIELVEYTGTCQVDENARVGSCVKV